MRALPESLSRVMGRSFMRLPIALKMALATAAGAQDDARLADALRAVRPVAVVVLDEDDLDLRRVQVSGNARAVVAGVSG